MTGWDAARGLADAELCGELARRMAHDPNRWHGLLADLLALAPADLPAAAAELSPAPTSMDRAAALQHARGVLEALTIAGRFPA